MELEIKVYGTPHCGACKLFTQKLEKAGLKFEYSTDPAELAAASAASGLMSAPIVKLDNEYLNATDASKRLGI